MHPIPQSMGLIPARLGLFLVTCAAAAAFGQAAPTAQDPSVLNSLDSLQREITRRILSDADKKEIRSCDREKAQFLKQCRVSDTAMAGIDRRLNEAKLQGADPNDPAIQSLLERKFLNEKACDEAFAAKPRGKQCLAGEDKRRKALAKALKGDPGYQKLLRRSVAVPSESL